MRAAAPRRRTRCWPASGRAGARRPRLPAARGDPARVTATVDGGPGSTALALALGRPPAGPGRGSARGRAGARPAGGERAGAAPERLLVVPDCAARSAVVAHLQPVPVVAEVQPRARAGVDQRVGLTHCSGHCPAIPSASGDALPHSLVWTNRSAAFRARGRGGPAQQRGRAVVPCRSCPCRGTPPPARELAGKDQVVHGSQASSTGTGLAVGADATSASSSSSAAAASTIRRLQR